MTNRPNDNILNFINELEEKLPADVSVMEFSSNDTTATLRVQAADKDTAAGIIQNLRNFSSLQYVAVDSIQEVQEEADEEDTDQDEAELRRYVEFTVSCTYYPNGYLPGQELTFQLENQSQGENNGTQAEGQVE